jgi:hypothetical protein
MIILSHLGFFHYEVDVGIDGVRSGTEDLTQYKLGLYRKAGYLILYRSINLTDYSSQRVGWGEG